VKAVRANQIGMNRHPHILNASTNLLAICFIIIGSLKFTNMNARSFADEVSWLAALMFFVSTIVSYLAIRNDGRREWQLMAADVSFIGGLVALMTAVFIAAVTL
jgi:hypothetical protein